MLYAYMNGIYTTRDMERCCQRDINFMYLLEGAPAPDHATLARFRARFRSLHFVPVAQRLLAETASFLYAIGELSGEVIFIDGTKVEACANKYTFVWKKAITKNLDKLLNKLADFTAECEENYGFKLIYFRNLHPHRTARRLACWSAKRNDRSGGRRIRLPA